MYDDRNIEEYDYESSEAALERRIKSHAKMRDIRKKNIFLNRLRSFIRFSLIIFLLYASYRLYHCKMWYVSSDVFASTQNKSLKIIGNRITPSYKILNELRRTELERKPIFLLDTTKLEENVKKLAPVKNVYIRRLWWPARFVVMVDERLPILSISPNEEAPPIAFFAQGGMLIGRDYLPLSPQFKTYLVLTYGTRGDDYRNWDEAKVSKIEKLARIIEANSGEKIVYLDFRDPKDIYVKLQTTSLRLGEFNSSLMSRISSIGAILDEVKKMDKPAKYIDLRWEETYYIKLE